MSSGYCSNFVLVPSDKLMEGVKTELDTLILVLKIFDKDLDDLAFASLIDDFIEINDDENGIKVEQIDDLLQKVFDKFEMLYGVELRLCYHNSDTEGSCYDDVSGSFWEIDYGDMYQLTPAGKKIEGEVMRATFVSYG